MSAAVLPATSLARRRPRHGRWSLAIAGALALNALLVGVLARTATAPDVAVLPAAMPLTALPVPPPGPAAPVATAAQSVAEPPPVPSIPRMPALPPPAMPMDALAPPSPDGWLAGIGTGGATGAVAMPAPSTPGDGGGMAWDEAPRAIDTFDLARFYPLRQLHLGEGALVTLRIAIAADGAVSDARVLANDGHPAFAAASLRLVRAVRWQAARRGGHPVAGAVTQAIRWRVP